MMETDPFLLQFVLVMFAALSVLVVFYWFKQPSVVAYIAAGVLVGPHVFGFIEESAMIETLGHFGIVLLLFFIGTQVSLKTLVKNWRIVVVGTLMQILFSVALMGILGYFLNWEPARIILFGFVISLSSTAVILRFLESRGLLEKRIGKDVVGVLLAQDLFVIPMLITLSAMDGSFSPISLVIQLMGMVAIGIILFMVLSKRVHMPQLFERLATDNDYKLFLALLFCFGMALFTGFFQLSLAMGAFIGGIIAAELDTKHWMREQLHGFKTLFIALFFISIGLLIDLPFLWENLLPISIMVGLVFCANTFINALIFRWLRLSWRYSLYAGAILAQIGEFSFFLASVGLQIGAISTFGYQTSIAVIALSLLVSPLWIQLFGRFEKIAVQKQ